MATGSFGFGQLAQPGLGQKDSSHPQHRFEHYRSHSQPHRRTRSHGRSSSSSSVPQRPRLEHLKPSISSNSDRREEIVERSSDEEDAIAGDDDMETQISGDFDHLKDLLTKIESSEHGFAQWAFPKAYRSSLFSQGYLQQELQLLRESMLRYLRHRQENTSAKEEASIALDASVGDDTSAKAQRPERPSLFRRLDSIDGDIPVTGDAERMRDWQRKYQEVFNFMSTSEEGRRKLEVLYVSTRHELDESSNRIEELEDKLRDAQIEMNEWKKERRKEESDSSTKEEGTIVVGGSIEKSASTDDHIEGTKPESELKPGDVFYDSNQGVGVTQQKLEVGKELNEEAVSNLQHEHAQQIKKLTESHESHVRALQKSLKDARNAHEAQLQTWEKAVLRDLQDVQQGHENQLTRIRMEADSERKKMLDTHTEEMVRHEMKLEDVKRQHEEQEYQRVQQLELENMQKIQEEQASRRAQQVVLEDMRKQHDEHITNLNSNSEAEKHELRSRHNQEIQEQTEKHTKALSEQRTKYDEHVSKINKATEAEKEELLEKHQQQILELHAAAKGERDQLQTQHQQSLEDMQGAHAKEIDSLKEQQVKTNTEAAFFAETERTNIHDMHKKAHDEQKAAHDQEIMNLRSENEEKIASLQNEGDERQAQMFEELQKKAQEDIETLQKDHQTQLNVIQKNTLQKEEATRKQTEEDMAGLRTYFDTHQKSLGEEHEQKTAKIESQAKLEMDQARQEHETQLQQTRDRHQEEIKVLQLEMEKKHSDLRLEHNNTFEALKTQRDKIVDDLKSKTAISDSQLRAEHKEMMQDLRDQHASDQEFLKRQHNHHVDSIKEAYDAEVKANLEEHSRQLEELQRVREFEVDATVKRLREVSEELDILQSIVESKEKHTKNLQKKHDGEMQALRSQHERELHKQEAGHISSLRQSSEVSAKELEKQKSNHDVLMKTMNTDFDKRLTEAKRHGETSLKSLEDQHKAKISVLHDQHATEREKERKEHENRLQAALELAGGDIATLKTEHESKLRDVCHQKDLEINQLKESHAQRLHNTDNEHTNIMRQKQENNESIIEEIRHEYESILKHNRDDYENRLKAAAKERESTISSLKRKHDEIRLQSKLDHRHELDSNAATLQVLRKKFEERINAQKRSSENQIEEERNFYQAKISELQKANAEYLEKQVAKAKAEHLKALSALRAQFEASARNKLATISENEERIMILEHDVGRYHSETAALRERANQAEQILESIRQRRRDTQQIESQDPDNYLEQAQYQRKESERQLTMQASKLADVYKQLDDAMRKRYDAERARDAVLRRSSSLSKTPDRFSIVKAGQTTNESERNSQNHQSNARTSTRAFPPSSFNDKTVKDLSSADQKTRLKKVAEETTALEASLAARFSQELASAKQELLQQFHQLTGPTAGKSSPSSPDAADRGETTDHKNTTPMIDERELRFSANLEKFRQPSQQFQDIVDEYESRIAHILGTEEKMGSDLSIGPEQFEHMAQENYRRSFESVRTNQNTHRRIHSSYALLSSGDQRDDSLNMRRPEFAESPNLESNNRIKELPTVPKQIPRDDGSYDLRDAFREIKTTPNIRLRRPMPDTQPGRMNSDYFSDSHANKSKRRGTPKSPLQSPDIDGEWAKISNKALPAKPTQGRHWLRSLAERQSSAINSFQQARTNTRPSTRCL